MSLAGQDWAERPLFPSGDIPDSDSFVPKWCTDSSFSGQSHGTLLRCCTRHLGAAEATPNLLAVATWAAGTKAR